MFRPLAFAVAATMVGSLVYALLIAPVFYRIMHRSPTVQSGKKRGRVLTLLLAGYEAVLRRVLGHPVVVSLLMVILTGVAVTRFLDLGREFMPTLREGTIQCLAHLNPNVSLAEIKRVCSELSREIVDVPEVEHVLADIGYGEVGPHVHHTNFGCMTVTLKGRKTWRTAQTQEGLVTHLSKRIADFLGVSASFSQPINHEVDGLIAGAGAAVVAKVFGEDMDELQRLAGEVEHVLADLAGVADLRVEQVSGQTQLQIDLDNSALGRYGLNRHEETIRRAINGEEVGHVFEGERAFRILVRLDKRFRENEASIRRLLIRTPLGARVPLSQLATFRSVTGLRQISREGTQRYVSVQCNVRGRDVGTFVRDASRRVEERIDLPIGYRVDWGGQFELQQAANRRFAIVIPVTLLLVLSMLYGLFGSLRNVVLIALNVPLALVGGILALSAFGENISIPSSIGFIALFGIALTDGVVLISRFERLRQEGVALRDAVVKGCRSKFRPVLMTTVTTALGLLPLIIATGTGAEVQRPLAIVVVGGLASSTLLTLFVVPTLYLKLNGRAT